jgi:uncharacterized protein DUF2877
MGASDAVGPLLTGPRRAVEVAVATPHAVYLRTGDPEHPALCLADRYAVRVPCAVLLDRLPRLTVGQPGLVGRATVALPSFEGRVARWWRAPRPAVPDAGRLRATLAARVPPPGPLKVEDLLGRGPGLTPLGDDLLMGALVTLRALGTQAFQPLARTVRTLAPSRTTFVSTALLHHAMRGECVPELAAVLDGGPVDALLGVGHTSGTGLAQGVLAALDLVPA